MTSHYSENLLDRWALVRARCFLLSSRCFLLARGTLVFRLGLGGTRARAISDASLWRASARLRSRSRKREAVRSRTPSLLRRLPARAARRFLTGCARLALRAR